MTFTCTLDANPAPSYSIWASGGQSQKWDDLDTDKNSITLILQKQHNKVNMFCRADGSLLGYPVNSVFKSYTVQCRQFQFVFLFYSYRINLEKKILYSKVKEKLNFNFIHYFKESYNMPVNEECETMKPRVVFTEGPILVFFLLGIIQS